MSGPNKYELPSAQTIKKSLENNDVTVTTKDNFTRRHFLGSLFGLTLATAGVYLTRRYPDLNEPFTNSEIVKKIAPSQKESTKQQVGLLIEPKNNFSTSVTGWKISGKIEPENLNLEKTFNPDQTRKPISVTEMKRFRDEEDKDQPGAIDYGTYFGIVQKKDGSSSEEKLIKVATVVSSNNGSDNKPDFEYSYLKDKSVITFTNPKSGLSKKYQVTITPGDNPLVQFVPLID